MKKGIELYKHQEEFVYKHHKKHLLAWEVGSGKTLAAIASADIQGFDILVVCPKSLKDQWESEIEKFSERPEDYKVMTKEEFKKFHKDLRYFNFVIIDEAHNFANYKSQLHKSMIWYLKKHERTQRICPPKTMCMVIPAAEITDLMVKIE